MLGTRDKKGQKTKTKNKQKKAKQNKKPQSHAKESYRLMEEKGEYILRIG